MIELRVTATFDYRDLVTRATATGCKVAMTGRGDDAALTELSHAMVSVVGEAFNNVVEHAYGGRGDGEVTIRLRTLNDVLEVQMTDQGKPFEFDDAPEPDLAALPESGMGIYIMRELADEVDYVAGPPNVLTMRKRLPSGPAG
ncbi:MAG TPA: ATP-binding protein [Polyangiaceae bacterium]|nr:ATP-binding protein [Polyangiaceae bacterium]